MVLTVAGRMAAAFMTPLLLITFAVNTNEFSINHNVCWFLLHEFSFHRITSL